ncbi:hypothetical protein LY76DRAFT_351777 [Colletotrichum caudatum]|nr:hypothetical protein LY76DRAFT_351777 [Colletotrichum caudatum]
MLASATTVLLSCRERCPRFGRPVRPRPLVYLAYPARRPGTSRRVLVSPVPATRGDRTRVDGGAPRRRICLVLSRFVLCRAISTVTSWAMTHSIYFTASSGHCRSLRYAAFGEPKGSCRNTR